MVVMVAPLAAVPKRKVGFDAHRIAPTSSACAVVDSITFHVIPASGTVLAADTIGCSLPRQTASHAKAAAGVTPGLPSYSTAGGCEFYSTGAWLAAVRAAVKAEKAARGAPPEDYERTDGELNWRQRADLASELAAQKHRVGGRKATRDGPT